MGRKKLEIKARETREGKQVTFSKRRMGVEKKAQELATLCDIRLLLLLFSPGQRLSWISGSRGSPEEVLKSYAEIPFQERSRRKIEVLEQLNRAFKKSDHEINVDGFSRLTTTTQSIKDLLTAYHDIRRNLLEKLRECETPKTIEHASQMEKILRIRLQQIEMHKQLTQANQSMPFYNQVLVDEKSLPISRQYPILYDETIGQSLPISRHSMVPYDETIAQRCFAVGQPFGSIPTSQDAWETRCLPTIYKHGPSTLLHDLGTSSITPGYLSSPSGASEYWLTTTMQPCADHTSTYLDHSCCHTNDIHEQSALFGRDTQYNNLVFPVEDSHASHSASLLAKQDSLLSSDRAIRAHHDVPWYQPEFDYEDVQFINSQVRNEHKLPEPS